MTAQKGLFNRNQNENGYQLNEERDNYINNARRSRQRLVSAMIALAGLLLLLLIIAVVAFICWKGVSGARTCDSCNMQLGEQETTTTIYSMQDSQSDEFDEYESINSNPRPIVVVTTLETETSAKAPPRTTPAPRPSDDHLPWYARLPLIGWMFRDDDTPDEIVARITIS